MSGGRRARIEAGRQRLLRRIGSPPDVTLIRPHGNLGDELIHAGTRQLLSRLPRLDQCEVGIDRVRGCRGHTALVGGGGGWCRPFHGLAAHLPAIEKRFERVIVLPSSFDVTVDAVRRALERTRAVVFAREPVSFRQIRGLCDAELAHDCAFYFDFAPYACRGAGVLTAFRTDEESARRTVPAGNRDVSVRCSSLDQWLWTIARHELIRTDRAHVTIAGAMLGKRVEFAASSYHKVPAIVAHSLRGFPVSRLPHTPAPQAGEEGAERTDAERRRLLERLVATQVPAGATFLLVDDAAVALSTPAGRLPLPFLERQGRYWGRPADDAQAIDELERLRGAGAACVVFAWPAFWWLEHYAGFRQHLRTRYHCTVEDGVGVCFDLRSPVPGEPLRSGTS